MISFRTLIWESIFIGILLVMSGHSTIKTSTQQADKEWKLKKEKNGIQIYTRDAEGTKFKAFKAITTIEAPLEWVLELLMDVPHKPNWMADLQNAELLEIVGDHEQIEYYESEVPGPFRDRDIILRARVIRESDTKIIIAYDGEPNFLPEKEKYVRITTASGKWILTSMTEEQTQVEYGMLLDPGGNLPAWIVNLFIVDGPMETLTNLKEMTALRKRF